MQNDAVVVPLRKQVNVSADDFADKQQEKPDQVTAAGKPKQDAQPLVSINPDLADAVAASTKFSSAAARDGEPKRAASASEAAAASSGAEPLDGGVPVEEALGELPGAVGSNGSAPSQKRTQVRLNSKHIPASCYFLALVCFSHD